MAKPQKSSLKTLKIGVVELADLCGVTRQSVVNWRKAGLPEPLILGETMKWFAAERQRINTPTNSGDDADLKTKKLELEIEKLRIANQRQLEKLVDPQVVQQRLANALNNLRQVLQAIVDREDSYYEKIGTAIDKVVAKVEEL